MVSIWAYLPGVVFLRARVLRAKQWFEHVEEFPHEDSELPNIRSMGAISPCHVAILIFKEILRVVL